MHSAMHRQRIGFWPRIVLIVAMLGMAGCTEVSLVETEFVAEVPAEPAPWLVEVIAKGAPISGAYGISFCPEGNLYIASVGGQEVLVMNPFAGQILERMGPEAGVKAPDDLVFGPDGSLYWTAIFAGEVGRLSPEGDLTTQRLAPGVNPITFSPDGRLFVGLAYLGDGLYELDPELRAPPRPIIVASEENPFPLGFPNAFSFGPDGRLYASIVAAGMVVSIDVDSCENTSNPWADCDIRPVADGFAEPVAAKFDPQNRLYVVNYAPGEVVLVDTETGEKTVIVAGLPDGPDNLAFCSDGHPYLSNGRDASIARILPNGEIAVVSPGGMIAPGGVAVVQRPDGRSSVFVADFFRLYEFDGSTGAELGYAGASVMHAGLTSPVTASADGTHLVISSWFASAVQVWDPDEGQVLEQHMMPVPLNAIRFQGDLLVADLALGGLAWAGSHDVILGQPEILLPTGLAARDDTLWVADWATGIVWQVQFEGKRPLSPTPVAQDLVMPEGLALDMDGGLLVAEAGAGRLSRIDLATGDVAIVAEGLELGAPGPEGIPPTWVFNGVAVDASGAIYVTGDVGRVLYRISKR